MKAYHIPVLASEAVEYLAPQPGGIYVDATLGAGGHSRALFESCPQITVFGFDRDPQAIAEAQKKLTDYSKQLSCINAPFSTLRSQLALRKIPSIDGVLFDLGVSSHQIDTTERGFSFDRDADLDMRMDSQQKLTAAKIVNNSKTNELTRIFKDFGEEQHAGRIARAIDKARLAEPILRTSQLARVIESVAGSGTRDSLKTKLRVFQALRIAVNNELGELQQALNDAIMILKPGGRLVLLSYHSLEDRIVKNTFRDAARGCLCPPRQIQCTCGKKPMLRVLTGRPVCASEQELSTNPRAHSAKLRAAEKLNGELT